MTKSGPTQIPTWWLQSNFREFAKEYFDDAGSVLLFVGSGVSINANLPNWHDLLTALADYYDQRYRRPTEPSRVKERVLKRLSSSARTDTKYLRAGSELERAFAPYGKEALANTIQRIVTDKERAAPASPLHDAIARMSLWRVITTNYDTLLEDALEKVVSRTDYVVTDPHDEKNFSNSPQGKKPLYILKIHGDIRNSASRLVLSKESFDELYTHKGRLNERFEQVVGTLLRHATTILFVGYSHADPYVKRLLNQQMMYSKRDHIYTLVPRQGPASQFAQHVTSLGRELGVKFITYSPDDNYRELLDFLQYFETGQREKYNLKYGRLAERRRPTVIMLHCGGTIGAKSADVDAPDQPLQVVVKKSRYDAALQKFSDQVLEWYQREYVAGEEIDLDILWEIMPVEGQMFSENASPALWNLLREKLESIIYKYFHGSDALRDLDTMTPQGRLGKIYEEEYPQYKAEHHAELTELRFRDDFTQRYILGIIVLFGTDTMAYAAPAMGLSLQHLPCPVILTGANQPPFDDDRYASKSQFYAASDAWTNLTTSLYFLHSFGHRLTEVFVSFGGTIHSSVNLRKRATEIIPSGRRWPSRRYSEPFYFRNLSLRGQYMFKLIDGMFCNNYYPNPYLFADLANSERGAFVDLRHIRFDALRSAPSKDTVGDKFGATVAYVEISPCFPRLDVRSMEKAGIRAILAEGYASGTFPSGRKNPFTAFLKSAFNAGMPVVLISRYGTLASQQEYDIAAELKGKLPIVPLYQIVAETALPLLSIVTANIDASAWARRPGESPIALMERRKRRLASEITAIFDKRPNIIRLELAQIANRQKLLEKAGPIEQESAKPPFSTFQKQRGKFPTPDAISGLVKLRESNYADGFAVLSRRDLMLIFEQFKRLFEKVQASPDGLEHVCNIGFDIGLPLWDSFRKDLDSKERDPSMRSTGYHFAQGPEIRAARIKRAQRILDQTCQLLDAAGISQIDATITSSDDPGYDGPPRSIALSSNFRRYQENEDGERGAVMTFSQDERRYFRMLRQGCPEDRQPDEYRKDLEHLDRTLLKRTWSQSPAIADWLLLGVMKGAACASARFLRIDNLAKDAPMSPERLHLLRGRVKTNVINIDQAHVEVGFEYVELNEGHR